MVTEFIELWVILGQVGVFGGMTLAQVAAVYGLASLAFGIADLLFGETDRLSSHIRSGRLETLLIRPVPLLLQVSSLDLSLRRIGRIGTGLVMYVIALGLSGYQPGLWTLLLAVVAPLAGAAIFSALFTIAGAVHHRGGGAVLVDRRAGVCQRLHLWRQLCGDYAGVGIRGAVAGVLYIRDPGDVGGVRPGAHPARLAGPCPAAHLEWLARGARGGGSVGRRGAGLAGRGPALHRGRG